MSAHYLVTVILSHVYYLQITEVCVSKHNLAAVLQIGRLFTTPALLHAKVDNKCRDKVVHAYNSVESTRKKS